MSDRLADLRAEFLHLLTTDSETKDRRRKEFNQAIFHPDGWAIWSSTELDMVMSKFDKAARLRAQGVTVAPDATGRYKRGPCVHGNPCRESQCVEYGRWVAPDATGLRWGEDVFETECQCGALGDEVHATDCLATPAASPDATGLRKAAQAVIDAVTPYPDPDRYGPVIQPVIGKTHPSIAALRAALDVERPPDGCICRANEYTARCPVHPAGGRP